MSFTPEQLKPYISTLTYAPCFWVAYSGGCDSHVLLHSLVALRSEISAEIKAVHINHGLSPLANEWEAYCRNVCEQLAVPYLSISVNAKAKKSSPEEAARHARYAEWKKLLNKNEVLLLAHHQDDQAETVLIQLMRGSGVKGLAAMPVKQAFSQGLLCRPMLGVTREDIHCYASEHGLNWINDPSNFDTDFDRNFLRHEVVPSLETRWPALKKTLSRTASHLAEADQLLTELAAEDWQQVHENNKIKISSLVQLSENRQRNVLRYWIAKVCDLTLPDTVHLQRIINEVLTAAEDAKPEVIWPGAEVRRYQGLLYAQEKTTDIPSDFIQPWSDIKSPLKIKITNSKLIAKMGMTEGLSQEKLKGRDILLQFRQGGESCRPVGRGQTHQLKKLFQEWQIPPWQRSSVPLLYIDGELAQVVGYCYCETYAAVENEPSWTIELQK